MLAPWKKSYDKHRQCNKKQRHYLANKGPSSQSYGFSRSMDVRVGPKRKLSTKELMLLNCGVGEGFWESLDCKEIQPVHSKGDQPWIFIGRTDAEAEAPILWPPDAKKWLLRKDPDARKDWRQEEKGTTEDEIVGWHHWLNGHEFEQIPADNEAQGSLMCCSPWGRRVRHDWATKHKHTQNIFDLSFQWF